MQDAPTDMGKLNTPDSIKINSFTFCLKKKKITITDKSHFTQPYSYRKKI